jgi:DNA-binding transcriptional regulator YiaG
MTSPKPSRTAFAKAVPLRTGGYRAQYALPGLLPEFVINENGRPIIYDTAGYAESDSARALIHALNSRLRYTRKAGQTEAMSAADFAVALAESGMSAIEFSQVLGVPEDRVMKWLNAAADIPHWARLVLELCLDPETQDRAFDITDAALIEQKEPE